MKEAIEIINKRISDLEAKRKFLFSDRYLGHPDAGEQVAGDIALEITSLKSIKSEIIEACK